MEDTHFIVSIRTSPHMLGHPTRRTRRLSAGIAKSAWIWCGPEQHDVQADFHNAFGRALTLTGDIYFVASEEDQIHDNERLADLRGNTVRPGIDLKGFDFVKTVCCPSQQRHWLGYQQVHSLGARNLRCGCICVCVS